MSKAIICLFAAVAVAGGAVFLHNGNCPFSSISSSSSCCDKSVPITADETLTASASCCDSETALVSTKKSSCCSGEVLVSAKKASCCDSETTAVSTKKPSCCDSETTPVSTKKPSCCAGEATKNQEAFAAAFGGVIVKDTK